jgi:hypothetical protein
MSLNKSHPDLEPLIETQNPSVAGKNSRWRINKKVKLPGLVLRRRDPKAYQEKCGRVRLLAILCGFVFLVLYLTNLKPYQNMMVVRIPEDDNDLPGPKGTTETLI